MEESALITHSKISGIMKRICSFLIIVLVFFSHIFNAFSMNIDGMNPDGEWDNASANVIFEGESNCKINFAAVKNIINAEESALYLCFMFIDPFLETDNTSTGVSLTVGDSDSFTFDVSDSPFHKDTYIHSFEGALTVDENNGATCEIRLGFKEGLPRIISLVVRFIDSAGVYSNEYPVSIVNNYYSETTELIINDYENDINYENVYDYENEKTTDYTLKKPTTKPEKKKTEFYIQTSPPYSYTGRTKAPKRTSAAKTTEMTVHKTTKPKPEKIYYEKEIIISQVYITEGNPSTDVTSVTETVTSESTSSAVSSTASDDSPPLSKGVKYKILIGTLSAISFTVIAVSATLNNKKSQKDPDSR